METQRSDKIWMIGGLILLVGICIYSLFEAYKIKQASVEQPVRIILKAKITNAQQVKIAGSFNNWQARCCLEKVAGTDEWKIQLQLNPGVYEYVFIVDGEHWVPETANGKLQDGLGGSNGVLYVNRTVVKLGGGNG